MALLILNVMILVVCKLNNQMIILLRFKKIMKKYSKRFHRNQDAGESFSRILWDL